MVYNMSRLVSTINMNDTQAIKSATTFWLHKASFDSPTMVVVLAVEILVVHCQNVVAAMKML